VTAGTVSRPDRLVRHVEMVMGMAVSYAFREPPPAGALERSVSILHDADAMFSTYKVDSEISRFDRGELTTETCSPEVLEVLEACEGLRVDTDGYFDAWVTRADEVPRLDPSGYVKGWAVDRAARALDEAGVAAYAINAGGDVTVRSRPGDPPWRVGVRHPDHAHQVVAVVAARDLAVATSATYERGEHILDPHTEAPPSGIVSLTVVGHDLALVDAYATAAFAMGDAGPAWVADRPGYGVFAVTVDGRGLSSPTFDRHRLAS
jgi:FAD:protein FMN transferase